jgi:hypothetical protein
MSVRVDEPRHHDAPARVDYLNIAARRPLDFLAAAHALDAPVAHQHGAVADHRKFAHLRAAACARRPCEGDKLAAIPDY